MTLSNRKSKLQATKSFVKVMSDMAERAARQTAETLVPVQQLQPIPVKNTRIVRRPARPASMNWIFS